MPIQALGIGCKTRKWGFTAPGVEWPVVGNCVLSQGQGQGQRRPTGVTEGLWTVLLDASILYPPQKTKKVESPLKL